MTSDFLMDAAISDENFNLLCLKFLLTNSSRPGSYIGIKPSPSRIIFFLSISAQITLLPSSEKQVPETRPT